MCPGNFGSAGKRLGGKMRKGKVSLRPCLSQGASPIPMTKNSYLSAAITLTASTQSNPPLLGHAAGTAGHGVGS